MQMENNAEARINGIGLRFLDVGKGIPVVLIHGNGETHMIFEREIEQLTAAGYRVIAPDSRGHGESGPVQEFHYTDMAEDVFQLIQTLHLEKPLYYGHSDGGIIGLLLEIRHPGTLGGMAISGTNLSPQGLREDFLESCRSQNAVNPDPLITLMLQEPHIAPEELDGIRIPALVTVGENDLILPEESEPVIWRGPIIANMVKQFYTDVVWGQLDYLFVDMPPGTGDVPLTVFQSLPVDGIVIVTSPQDLVKMIVTKAYKMAARMDIPVLGLVENYSYITCPDCGKKIYPFGESRIGEAAEELQIPVLGRIPIRPEMAEAADSGAFAGIACTELDEAAVCLRGLNGYIDLQYRYVNYRMQDPTDSWGYNTTGEYVIDDSYNFFNPKFGLNYDINTQHKVYASYAIAHKEPVRNNYEDNQGLPLSAERLNDLELGYKFLSPRFSAGVNFYWMDYKDQFVLTGALNEIGEAVALNVPKSYRLGVELEAAWQPVDWFRWDANATFSKNRVKDSKVTLSDKEKTTVSVGDAPLSFSPDVIFNNIFSFNYRGLKASLQSQYIGKQYMTNSGFDTMIGWDADGNKTTESIALDGHFSTNVDLSYTFNAKSLGLKEMTVGVTMYNLFSAKFDNNGWAAPKYMMENGQVVAYNGSYATDGALRDQWAAGFAPSAPFNMMGHLSINF